LLKPKLRFFSGAGDKITYFYALTTFLSTIKSIGFTNLQKVWLYVLPDPPVMKDFAKKYAL